MRGISSPPAVPEMSNNAEASGCWVLMPTCWASREVENRDMSSKRRSFMGMDLRSKVQFDMQTILRREEVKDLMQCIFKFF
jgi:hypothetical protein